VRAVVALSAIAALLAATPADAARFTVKLTTSTATPVVDQPWRYTLTARTASGAPVRARVKLQLLLGTTVVGCWKGGAMAQCSGSAAGDWISFRGKRSGVLRFPAQAVGVKLTFQAIVKIQGLVRKLRAPVTVQAAPAPEPSPYR
jgi:hypothetical protein